MKDTAKQFAEWFSASIQARGVTQAEVARQLGVADAQVSRWRRGFVVPSRDHARRIAATFGVPTAAVEQLVGLDGPVAENTEPGDIDPVRQAEEQAVLHSLATVLETTVPRHLWKAYVEACTVLAEQMTAAFDNALESTQSDVEHHIGFHIETDHGESRRGAGR